MHPTPPPKTFRDRITPKLDRFRRNPYVRGSAWGLSLAVAAAYMTQPWLNPAGAPIDALPGDVVAWAQSDSEGQAQRDQEIEQAWYEEAFTQAQAIDVELYDTPADVGDTLETVITDPELDLTGLQGVPVEDATQALTGHGHAIAQGCEPSEKTLLFATPGLHADLKMCERVLAFPIHGPRGGMLVLGVLYGHVHFAAHLPERSRYDSDAHRVVWHDLAG